MFVSFVLYACLALWIFANNMEDSVMDNFVTEKISHYSKSEGIFNLVIDTVQRDLQCCGFKSSADWSGSFPASCCLEVEEECQLENVHSSSCLKMIRYTSLSCNQVVIIFFIRSHLLQPDSMVGLVGKILMEGFYFSLSHAGVTLLLVVAVVGATTALSFCLCLTARR